MELSLYQIDAFTDHLFSGNPACVVPLTKMLPDALLLKIAQENAVAETAFFLIKDQKIFLRWFTPEVEMDLCGHATLATAHCLKTILKFSENIFQFETLSGILVVEFKDDLYHLNFPSRMPKKIKLPLLLQQSINIPPVYVFKARDYVLIYESEYDINNIIINRVPFDQLTLGAGGVIVSSEGDSCDFVSRFFTPKASILEDPVTGSAHCSLIPFWAERLKKQKMLAKQLSLRGGTLYCRNLGERVLISGKAITYSKGSFVIK